MYRDVDWILSLSTAVFAALFLGTIAYDEIGMTPDVIRTEALSPAGLLSASVAAASLLKRRK
jgi:hypothetical protein